MWHVSSRSDVATLRTAIQLLLTYWERSKKIPGEVVLAVRGCNIHGEVR